MFHPPDASIRMLTEKQLDAYLARVGYLGPREPTLSVLHALTLAHAQSIPFENLDVLLGRGVNLDPEVSFRKLVEDRRGGYCFEQNGLLLRVLQTLGFNAAPLSARVRLQRPRDYTPSLTHLFLRVEIDGESWLTDVGIGGVSLTSAVRLHAEGEQSTPHEPRRIVQEGSRRFHQIRFGSEWEDVYEFSLAEMPFVDRELGNWYTSTHPNSLFKHRLMAARALDGGRRASLVNGEFSIRHLGGHTDKRQVASPEELLEILAEHFGLHFPAGTTFGVPLTEGPNE